MLNLKIHVIKSGDLYWTGDSFGPESDAQVYKSVSRLKGMLFTQLESIKWLKPPLDNDPRREKYIEEIARWRAAKIMKVTIGGLVEV
jgi:hypothetical protein